MKALIFGITGQDGIYLTQLCQKNSIEVVGVSRSDKNWIIGDVSKFEFVESVIKFHRPDFVFHLAANSTTKHYALFENHDAISTGALNILESVRLHSPKSKVFLSGSAMQFENHGTPISEETPFSASSAYSLARIHSTFAGRLYREKFNIAVYNGYLFNHESPFRREIHVNQKIVSFVKKISGNLEIGDINVQKECSFAGDIAEAIWILVNQDNIFEAVIGSGKAYKIENWLEICFSLVNKDWRDYVVTNNKFVAEYDILVSNPTLIKSLGWQPKTSIEELAKMMIID